MRQMLKIRKSANGPVVFALSGRMATVENRVDLFKSGPTAEWFKIYAKAHESGGHFGPWENPDAFMKGIRETFRILRRA